MQRQILCASLALGIGGAALAQPVRPAITSVSHLAVYTSDPAKAEGFYVHDLGAARQPDAENEAGVRYHFSPLQFVEVLPLPPGSSTVLGLLDDYPTRSGYVITPVVIWGGGRLDPRPAPDEVVAVYRVGLHQLPRADSPRFIAIPESPRPVVQIPLGNDLIHAPTGAVLLQVRWLCLEGVHDPVNGLEQPVFAWK